MTRHATRTPARSLGAAFRVDAAAAPAPQPPSERDRGQLGDTLIHRLPQRSHGQRHPSRIRHQQER